MASASSLARPRTLIGPSVTFSRIVLCAKRLKLWKTIPTSARRCASALPSAGSGWPSRLIVPLSMVSSRLIARHSVLLPEPDGPITTTTSPRLIERLMSCRTCRSPNHLSTWSSTTRPSPAGVPEDAVGVSAGALMLENLAIMARNDHLKVARLGLRSGYSVCKCN